MTTNFRARVSFEGLVTDCLACLSGIRAPFYSGTSRGAASPTVCVLPGNTIGWDRGLWEEVVGPTLVTLALSPPVNGWVGSVARGIVAAHLRVALGASSHWAPKVDYLP